MNIILVWTVIFYSNNEILMVSSDVCSHSNASSDALML